MLKINEKKKKMISKVEPKEREWLPQTPKSLLRWPEGMPRVRMAYCRGQQACPGVCMSNGD